jgi:hypothetical protein
MRVGWLLVLTGVAAVLPVWGASGPEGPESLTPPPWASACEPSASLERSPVWFKGFGGTLVVGRLEAPPGSEPNLELVGRSAGVSCEREMAVMFGFCLAEAWTVAYLGLWLAPLEEGDQIVAARLALRQVSGAHFVDLPASLSGNGKVLLHSEVFPLAPYLHPLTGEIEALLHVVIGLAECSPSGGHGVAVRSVGLGVPGGG